MKDYLHLMLTCGLGLAAVSEALSQTAIQNLGFEDAQVIPLPYDPHLIWAAPALPGWTCYLGTNQVPYVGYDTEALDSARVGLISAHYPGVPARVVTGQYCAALQAGIALDGNGNPYCCVPSAIAQTGEIPSAARSILFKGTVPFSVSLGGTAIPLVVYSAQPTFKWYAGDVSQFAGQTCELRFTCSVHIGYLDAIRFRSEPIPEPGVSCLLLTGLWLLRLRVRDRRR